MRAFDAFARVLSDAFILVARDGSIRRANPAAGRLLLRTPATLLEATLAELTSTDPLALDEMFRAWRRTSAPLPAVLNLVVGDGRVVRCRLEGGRLGGSASEEGNVLLRLAPVETTTSQFLLLNRQIAELKSEVTRRRRAEDRLAGQNRLLASIAEGNDLHSVLDAIVRFVESRSGRAVCSILLLDEEQKLRPGAAPSLPEPYSRAIDGVSIGPEVGSCGTAAYQRCEVIVHDIASDPLWANFRELALSHGLRACWSTPLIGGESTVLGTVAMYYSEPVKPTQGDIELTAVARDLAIIAIERYHYDKTLRERAEQLLEADRRKDRFLAMLSHELRNPLAPIVSLVEVLAHKSRADPEAYELVTRLQRQAAQLSRLVDDLLDVSRIAHDILQLRAETTDLRRVLEDAVESVRGLVDERQQQLSVQQPSEPVWVSGDAARLRQMVSNLLTNSIKYTPPRGRIALTLDAEDDHAVIRVSDTGQGISTDQLTAVFDPFVQGSSASELRSGLGLGLTLVRMLAEAHDGSIDVTSAGEGKGCEFFLRIPLTEPPEMGAEEPRLPQDSEPTPCQLRILVVEDNQDSAEALRALLEIWGHTVETVYDGAAAIDLAATLRPDVLLVDLDIPGKDGIEVAQAVSAEGGASSDCMLIAVTGFGRHEDIERSLASGFHHHLVKPLDCAELRNLLADYSKRRATSNFVANQPGRGSRGD